MGRKIKIMGGVISIIICVLCLQVVCVAATQQTEEKLLEEKELLFEKRVEFFLKSYELKFNAHSAYRSQASTIRNWTITVLLAYIGFLLKQRKDPDRELKKKLICLIPFIIGFFFINETIVNMDRIRVDDGAERDRQVFFGKVEETHGKDDINDKIFISNVFLSGQKSEEEIIPTKNGESVLKKIAYIGRALLLETTLCFYGLLSFLTLILSLFIIEGKEKTQDILTCKCWCCLIGVFLVFFMLCILVTAFFCKDYIGWILWFVLIWAHWCVFIKLRVI